LNSELASSVPDRYSICQGQNNRGGHSHIQAGSITPPPENGINGKQFSAYIEKK
jgi:hypothetical protein